MGIFRRPQVEMPRVVLPKVELPTVELSTLRVPRVDRLKIGIPEVTFPKLDADAIGQAVAKRLGRRRSLPVRLIFLVLVGGSALAWLAIARSAAPVRAGLIGLVQETKTRLPAAVNDVKRWTGRVVYRDITPDSPPE